MNAGEWGRATVTMATLWFGTKAVLSRAYVILDVYDQGWENKMDSTWNRFFLLLCMHIYASEIPKFADPSIKHSQPSSQFVLGVSPVALLKQVLCKMPEKSSSPMIA